MLSFHLWPRFPSYLLPPLHGGYSLIELMFNNFSVEFDPSPTSKPSFALSATCVPAACSQLTGSPCACDDFSDAAVVRARFPDDLQAIRDD
jgi:hypothetical protein